MNLAVIEFKGAETDAGARSDMLEGMTAVMESDTDGIVTEMASRGSMTDGDTLSVYSKALLETGDSGEKTLAEMLNKVKLGNDLKGDYAERLEATVETENGEERRPTAHAVGYFTGAICAGANSITDDKKEQASILKDVLGFAVSHSPITSWSSSAIDRIIDIASTGDGNLGAEMYEAILPVDGNDHIVVSDEVQSIVHARFDDVSTLADI